MKTIKAKPQSEEPAPKKIITRKSARDEAAKLLTGARVTGSFRDEFGREVILRQGQRLEGEFLQKLPFDQLRYLPVTADLMEKVNTLSWEVYEAERVEREKNAEGLKPKGAADARETRAA